MPNKNLSDGTKPVAILFLVSVMLSTVIIPHVVAADSGIVVSMYPSEISINTTETESVDITIRNNEAVPDTFSISVWPSTTWAGITPNLEKYSITIDPGSEKTVKLYLTVSSDADEIITTFLVTAKSITSETITDSAEVGVRVLRKTAVYVSGITLDRYVIDQEGCVNITVDVTNLASDSGPYKLNTKIRKGVDIIREFDDDITVIEGKSMKSISNKYCFDKYADAGSYTISSILKSTLNKQIDSRSTSLKITEKSDLVVEKSVVYNPFAQIKTITIINEGNIVETNFVVTETVSSFVDNLFYPINQPTLTTTSGNKVVHSWQIDSLSPGEYVVIQYEIRYVSIWFTGLVIILVVILAFSYVYTPKITKKFTLIGQLKKGKEIPVLLEIKNATIHEIKNVVVNDTVPSIATLVDKYDTMRPSAKKTSSGVELNWKISSLKPLEERVLTYRIKPNVDIIGSMMLPRAILEYVNNKKEKKAAVSKTVEMK